MDTWDKFKGFRKLPSGVLYILIAIYSIFSVIYDHHFCTVLLLIIYIGGHIHYLYFWKQIKISSHCLSGIVNNWVPQNNTIVIIVAILATLTLRGPHLVGIVLSAAFVALGGHVLLQSTLVCDDPLQFLHLSIVLGKVLVCSLLYHHHLRLSLNPESQKLYTHI